MVQALPGGAGGSKGSDGNIPSGTSFEVVGKLRLYASKGSTLKSRGKHKKDVSNVGQGLGYTTTKTGGGAASIFGPGGDGASASGSSDSVIGQNGYRGSGGGGNASVAAPTYGGGGYLAIYY
jgi:hypothetical protein